MSYILLAFLINITSLLCSLLLLQRILAATAIKWRYYYLGTLAILSVLRSFIVFISDPSMPRLKYEELGLREYTKFILLHFSQYSRIIGLPLFVFATFFIILQKFSAERINRLYFWLLMIFILLLIILTIFYLHTHMIVCSNNICTLDIKGSHIVAKLHIVITLLTIASILTFSIILGYKKRIDSSTKYLILASIYYSCIPFFVFFLYLVYITGKESISTVLPLQRISTFLILLGILIFEKKIGCKRKNPHLKLLLAFKVLRDKFKEWLNSKNYRKEFSLVEIYESIEENNNNPEGFKIDTYKQLTNNDTVKVESIEDVFKAKQNIIYMLDEKYINYKQTESYKEIQTTYESIPEIEIALLDN